MCKILVEALSSEWERLLLFGIEAPQIKSLLCLPIWLPDAPASGQIKVSKVN